MERMTEFTDDMKYIIDLERENKKLKEDNKRYKEGAEAGQQLVEKLTSENKKLKAELDKYKNDIIYEEGLYD